VWNDTEYGDLAKSHRPTVAASVRRFTLLGESQYVPNDLLDLESGLDWPMDRTRRHPKALRSLFDAAERDP